MIAIIRRDHVVARGQGLEDCRGGGRTGGEGCSGRVSSFPALQQREALFQSTAVWIVGTGLDEATRILGVSVPLKRSRKVDGRRYRPCRLVNLVSRLGGDGFRVHHVEHGSRYDDWRCDDSCRLTSVESRLYWMPTDFFRMFWRFSCDEVGK